MQHYHPKKQNVSINVRVGAYAADIKGTSVKS